MKNQHLSIGTVGLVFSYFLTRHYSYANSCQCFIISRLFQIQENYGDNFKIAFIAQVWNFFASHLFVSLVFIELSRF